jgi:DNA-binding transcriptional LysR family regulator
MINFRLIRHLWLFLAVAEEQHFGRAARRLDMSQPPLTEQIQALEQALKVKLFERSRRGTQLTPVGAAILPAVRKFADQLERLELTVRETVAGKSGVLTIGAISSAMVDVLPPLIARLKADFPLLTVSVREIDSVEAIPALESGDIDLAFARLEGELGATVESLPLKQDRLMVALPGTHALAASPRVRLAALADEEFVMFSRQVSPVYFDGLVASCRSNGFSPRIVHEVRSVASQVAFVGCGQGIALVPASLKKLAPENVVFRPLKENLSVVTTAMAWSTARKNPLIEAVVEIVGDAGLKQKMRKSLQR